MAHRTPRLGMLHHALAAAMLLAPACAAPVEGDESEDFGEGESLVETNEYEPFSDITDIDGYNARFVIGNAIKDAVQEEFNQQMDQLFEAAGQMVPGGGVPGLPPVGP